MSLSVSPFLLLKLFYCFILSYTN